MANILLLKKENIFDGIINNIFFILIPILTLGIYIGFTTYLLCLILLIIRLFASSKDSVGVFLILFGGIIGGITRSVYPYVPIYGVLIMLFGVMLLWRGIYPFILKNKDSFLYLFVVYIALFISYIYGPKDEYGNQKIIEIIINGIFFLFVFSIINSSSKINNIEIAQSIILSVISFYVVGIQHFGYMKPESLVDYEWFRQSSNVITNALEVISYQKVGMNALFALIFFISNSKNNMKWYNPLSLIFYITCFHLILSSGARQAIFGLIVILLLRYVINIKNENRLKQIFYFFLSFGFILLVIYFLQSLDISFVSKVLDSNGDFNSRTGRGDQFYTSALIMQEHPLFGVGLGGFYDYGLSKYPHNIILEIITECGFFIFFIILLVVYIYIIKNKVSIKHVTANGTYFFLILSVIFVRAMVSGDLTESVALLSGIFVLKNQ